MPYRALLITVVTVAIALLAVSMWVSAVEPMLNTVLAATQPAPGTTRPVTTASQAATAPTTERVADAIHPPPPDVSMRRIIRGTLMLSFLLICMLLLIGLFATFHAWFRYRTMDKGPAKPKKTRYVDAWKLAGERMHEPRDEEKDPPAQ